MVYWCCVSLCEMYAQLLSCDPCELQGLRQCCRQLPITLSMFGSLQERVRFFIVFPQLVRELQVSRRCCGLVAVYAWCVPIAKNGCAVLFGVALRVRHESNSSLLLMRNPETILWLERAGISRVLCQTLIMQRAMEQKFGYQQENTSFSFWCGANESVAGLWNCHVWYARFLTVNACPCCLLLSVIWHGFYSTVCILTLSRIVRGPVVCSAHECSQQVRWLLDWSRIGLNVRSLENKCWWWHACEHYTLRSSET